MSKLFRTFTLSLFTASISAASAVAISQNAQAQDVQTKYTHVKDSWIDTPADFVNPFIGTQGVYNHRQAANVTPGAVLPHGMFNFGPEHAYTQDLLDESKLISKRVLANNTVVPVSPGGYNYDASRIKGFSFTRLSGTGCLGASGDIPVLPFTGDITHSPANDKLNAYYSASFNHNNETATPGYYQVKMGNGVDVKLTATTRTGIAEFTYDNADNAKLLFRTAASQLGSGAAYTKVDKENNEITGFVTSGNFCGYLGEFNRRDYYTLHFVAKLDKNITGSGGWQDNKLTPNATSATGGMGYGPKGIPKLGKGSGMWVDVDLQDGQTVTMRVGISYVSLDNARLNLNKEQLEKERKANTGKTFEQIKLAAFNNWNDTLKRVSVAANPTKDNDKLTTFYTALYHSLFHPNVFSDVNGQYWGFNQQPQQISKSQDAQYANFSGWDVYRSQLQLVTMVDRKVGSDIAQSLYNQAKQYNGVWDRWTHNSGATGVMSGDPSTIAIANFVAFGADDFDVKGAYESLYQAATVPTQFDLTNQGCPVFCRGQKPSLDQWLDINYISDESNSWEGASETLEQVSADFALSQLAKRVGDSQAEKLMLQRSSYWQNLFNPETGYVQGRMLNGDFKVDKNGEFDPFSGHLFVEGSPAQYLWMVPFDGGSLSRLVGGDSTMSKRLDNHLRKANGDWVLFRDSAEYADVSNQPSIATPWMYLYTGNAHKTQQTVRKTMEKLWHNSPKGIPGQDDLGQMSSWYVFSALGMYPLYPGRADMVLSSPVFTKAKIDNISIFAPNASDNNVYIESLKVNGKKQLASWIDESHIEQNIRLNFTLSDRPNTKFGQKPIHRPPSFNNRVNFATSPHHSIRNKAR